MPVLEVLRQPAEVTAVLAAARSRPSRVGVCTALGLLAALVVGALVWLPAATSGNEVSLVRPGADGPSAEAFRDDFPDLSLPAGVGHDGQQFYAVARDPLHPEQVADQLSPPRYRLQRILFPLVSGILHPGEGGVGLIQVMVALNLLGIALLGAAAGVLSVSLGGRPWVAGVVGLLPGAVFGLALGTPEGLAAGLALGAIALSLRGHSRAAVACGVAAVLTREVHVLLLVGFALWRRDRQGVALAGVPLAAAAVWWAYLRVAVEGGPPEGDFSVFGGGWSTAVQLWTRGEELLGLSLLLLTGVVLALVVVRRGRRTPLTAAVVLQLALLVPLHEDVVAPAGNLARAMLPLLCLALVLLALPRRAAAPAGSAARAQR